VDEPVELPGTLRGAVRAQFARSFRPPYEAPIVVVVNGVLMTGAWFLLPPHLLFAVHVSLAFPMILAGWMYADVPATNVVGSDARRSIAAIDDPVMLRRMLYAKNVVLWVFVAPVCSLIAVWVGIVKDAPISTIFSIAAIAVVPLGALGVAAWAGILFPYHPVALQDRWEHRRPFMRKIVRWLTLAVLPYGLVPLLQLVIILPTVLLWALTVPNLSQHLNAWKAGAPTPVPDLDFAIGVILACVVAIAVWFLGHHVGTRLIARRRATLIPFLEDPEAG
jgi:hypothetical protein